MCNVGDDGQGTKPGPVAWWNDGKVATFISLLTLVTSVSTIFCAVTEFVLVNTFSAATSPLTADPTISAG